MTVRSARIYAKLWYSCGIITWCKLLLKYGHRISLSRLHVVFIATLLCFPNSLLCALQHLIFAHRINKTKLIKEPIFIIGFWRSGTTLLHELLSCDTKHSLPDNYQTLVTSHLLLPGKFLKSLINFMISKRRPFDNMSWSISSPQEDEIGLLIRGVPSPFISIAFPNEKPLYNEYYELNIPNKAFIKWPTV